MSRDPDPTLTALNADHLVYVRDHDDLPAAHLPTEQGRSHDTLMAPTLAKHARWFAIPCRDCWPDAPPPGWESNADGTVLGERPGLAWQVTS